MSSTVVRRTAALAVLALATSIGGCQLIFRAAPTTSEPDAPETTPADVGAPAAVAAGDCLADFVPNENGSQDADLASVVDCTQPHHFAVYATEPLDSSLLADMGESEAEILKRRDDLRLNTGSRNEAYRIWSDSVCLSQLRAITGLSDVAVVYGSSGDDVDALPAGQFYFDTTISSEASWLAGDAYVVCSLGWTDFDGDLVTRQLPAGITVADLFTADFPVGARTCVAYGDTDYTEVPCDEAHWMELLVMFDPWKTLGEDARQAFDVIEAPDDAWKQIDTLCDAFTSLVVGKVDTTDTHYARAVWIYWDDNQVPTHVECGFAPNEAETMDIIGSIAGIGDGSPVLVDAATL